MKKKRKWSDNTALASSPVIIQAALMRDKHMCGAWRCSRPEEVCHGKGLHRVRVTPALSPSSDLAKTKKKKKKKERTKSKTQMLSSPSVTSLRPGVSRERNEGY